MEDSTTTTAATFGSETKRIRLFRLSEKVDRLGNLPDNVYDLIFSMVGALDIMNLSICSKRLQNLCYSATSLTIESFRINADTYNRFLINRGDRTLIRLRICWNLPSSNYSDRFGSDIGTWIRYAVRCNVEDLHIQLAGTKHSTLTSYRFPICLFSCPTLKNLTICMDGGALELPSTTGCVNLQSLVLKGIRIRAYHGKNKEKSSLFTFISSFCNLKDLWVEDIRGMKSIKVKSSSLESFTFIETRCVEVRNLSIFGDHLQRLRLKCCNFKGEGLLKIDAPNVKDFEWEGTLAQRCCFNGFKQLDVTKIFPQDLASCRNFHQVVGRFSRSKHLHLFSSLLKVLFEHGYLPVALHSTQNLILHINKKLNYGRTLAIGHFLKGTPNLKTLQIKSSVNYFKKNVHGVDVKFWDSLNLAFLDQLEMVEIELLNGVTELEIARFLLEHAKELKKMVIPHSSSFPLNVIQVVKKFKIMASSDRVVFKVK